MLENSQIPSVLKLDGVSKKFITPQGELSILENCNLEVKAGEKVAIIGPSGSGKSTLLSLIGLLDTPTTGSVFIDGKNTSNLSGDELADLRNEGIGFVFQGFELIAPFTVTENVTAPLDIALKTIDEVAVNTLIEEVGLTHRREALPFTLSGGEKQRVAIARALANQPNLILADEPTGSLDRETGEKVLALLLRAVDVYGKTLVIITHDVSIASRMDRVFEIRDRSLHESR